MVEGRFIYDCFVLNEKAKAVYYHGGQAALKMLPVLTAAFAQGKYAIIVNAVQEGAKWYYYAASTAAGLDNGGGTNGTKVVSGTAITTANWTGEVTANPFDNSGSGITASTNKFVRVVCVDASNYPISVGDAIINVGE